MILTTRAIVGFLLFLHSQAGLSAPEGAAERSNERSQSVKYRKEKKNCWCGSRLKEDGTCPKGHPPRKRSTSQRRSKSPGVGKATLLGLGAATGAAGQLLLREMSASRDSSIGGSSVGVLDLESEHSVNFTPMDTPLSEMHFLHSGNVWSPDSENICAADRQSMNFMPSDTLPSHFDGAKEMPTSDSKANSDQGFLARLEDFRKRNTPDFLSRHAPDILSRNVPDMLSRLGGIREGATQDPSTPERQGVMDNRESGRRREHSRPRPIAEGRKDASTPERQGEMAERRSGRRRENSVRLYDGGDATFEDSNGDVYTGEWAGDEGLKDGNGFESRENGTVYNGGFSGGDYHGYGMLTTTNEGGSDVYEGFFSHGKKHGKGFMKFANGDTFNGDWENDKMHGQGNYKFHNGRLYAGPFEKGFMSGWGTMRYRDGSKMYEGEWVRGKKQGRGTFYYKHQGEASNRIVPLRYEGEWSRGIPEGRGTMKYTGGREYEGDWVRGQQHGKGTFRMEGCGIVYKGDWVRGQQHGKGTYRMEGTTYKGDFVHGEKHGKGSMEFADGGTFDGYWEHDMMHGQGEYTYDDGRFYVGQFEKGFVSGRGTLRSPDGSKMHEGEWRRNKPHGRGTSYFKHQGEHSKPSPLMYDGDLICGRPEGRGTMKYTSGYEYEGNWVRGKKTGKGTFRMGGQTYIGDWVEDLMHGNGELRFRGVGVYSGLWVKGREDGPGKFRYENGDEYEGGWLLNLPDEFGPTEGKKRYTNGDTFEGVWKGKMRHGTYTWKNGDVYKGDIIGNVPSPYGTMTYANGNKSTGPGTFLI